MKHDLSRFYKASWIGALRIAGWSLLFLYAFGEFIPALPERVPLELAVRNTPVIQMLTSTNDNRTVREDFIPDRSKTNITWISDSSGIMIDQGRNFASFPQEKFRLLPVRVAEKLKQNHKLKNFTIPLYMRPNTMPVDMLIFSLHALQRKPDIIVLPLNNIWSFSHYQVAGRALSMHLAPKSFSQYPRLWPMLLAFCTPMHYLSAFAGSHIDILHKAMPFKEYLEAQFDQASARTNLAAPPPLPVSAPVTNVPFWIYSSMLKQDLKPLLGADGWIETALLYNKVMQHADPHMTDSWATDSLRHLLGILKKSGVPVLIYAWPVSDRFLNDTATKLKIDEMNAFLLDQKEMLAGTNIRILTPLPDNLKKTVHYLAGDHYHVTDEGIFDDYLAENIVDMLKRDSAIKGQTK